MTCKKQLRERKRERERERQTDRQTDRERERERKKERDFIFALHKKKYHIGRLFDTNTFHSKGNFTFKFYPTFSNNTCVSI